MAKHAVQDHNSTKSKLPVIITVSVAVIIIVVAVVAMLIPGGDVEALPEGTTIGGVDISGMDKVEAVEALTSNFDNVNSKGVNVSVSSDNSFFISLADVKEMPDYISLVDEAFEQSKGLFAAKKQGPVIEVEENAISEASVKALVEEGLSKVQNEVISSSIEETDTEISITKGASSVTFDADELTELVMNALSEGEEEISYEGTVNEDEEISLQEIYDSVYREAKDAYYDSSTGTIVAEEKGVSFDMAKAQTEWDNAKYGDVVTIPLIITEPEITEESLSESLFADKLSSKTTTLKGSSSNRINNVTKACSSINGLVLNPGDVFDYNAVLGERTKENGYLEAGAYENGQTVSQYGGGICQVSSMCYYCALYANLKINTRTNHMFPVSYMDPGLDATVSWGGPEFRFTNDRDYPIKIVAYVDGNSATVEFWGTDVDGSYVEMQYYTYNNYDTTYPDVVIGYSAVTTRCVYAKDGTLISRNREAYSSYNYHAESIKWPTESAEVSASPVPTPEESSAPSETPAETQTPVITETPVVTDPPTETQAPSPTEPVESSQPDSPLNE